MCDEEFGETLHLKDLGRSQRTYGTCGTMPPWSSSLLSPTHGGFRQWEGHEVKNNETMVGIALKYDITVEDIRRCNNLWTNDALWPGQVLRIPVKSPTNFLSPTMESSSYESPKSDSHSSQTNTLAYEDPNRRQYASNASSYLSQDSHSSKNISAATSNSSRRNTKSSMSSNLNSSSSDLGDGFNESLQSSQEGHFSHKKKNKDSSLSKPNISRNFDTEVSATEFLSRMDISIEATRKNMKKTSPTNTDSNTSLPRSIFDDPLSASSKDKDTENDRNRIIC